MELHPHTAVMNLAYRTEEQGCSGIYRHVAAVHGATTGLRLRYYRSITWSLIAQQQQLPQLLLAVVLFIPQSRQEAGAGAPLPVLVRAPEAEAFDRVYTLSFPF